ncbi:hypothetical protein BOSE127_80234 [Bosea sp. 127]|nr:hypothetical protein BOSE127_80234 [Bosea sp. 127]
MGKLRSLMRLFAERVHSLPPACGGEGLGMGGRKAGLGTSFDSHQAALPPTQPAQALPTASGGRA